MEDKFQFKIDAKEVQYQSLLSDKNDKVDEWRKAMSERDAAREDLKEMTTNR